MKQLRLDGTVTLHRRPSICEVNSSVLPHHQTLGDPWGKKAAEAPVRSAYTRCLPAHRLRTTSRMAPQTQCTMASEATDPPYLLSLPPELRNMIYEEIALATRDIKIVVRNASTATVLAKHPLLSVCRHLRAELGPVLVDTGLVVANTYICNMPAFHFEKLCKISDFIKTQSNSNLSRERKRMNLTITLSQARESSLETALQQTRTFVATKYSTDSPLRFAEVFNLQDVYIRTDYRLDDLP